MVLGRRRPAALLIALLAGALVLAGGGTSTPSASPAPSSVSSADVQPAAFTVGSGWKKVWGDEFTGTTLNPRNWRSRVQAAGGRRLCSTPDPRMVSVRNGYAVLGIQKIRTRAPGCPRGVFRNAMIGTGEAAQPGFRSTYGIYAARIKFQTGRGQHGAFWLQSAGGHSGAEIDVAEWYGNRGSGISTYVHKYDARGALHSVGGIQRSIPRLLGGANAPSKGFHVWSVEWSPSGYVFKVDGKVTLRTSRYVATTPEFMVLSLLTSDWEIPALNTTTSKMRVDWVRVYQRR